MLGGNIHEHVILDAVAREFQKRNAEVARQVPPEYLAQPLLYLPSATQDTRYPC